ncbi:MAG: MoaD/ThiS family protein [Candidatus Lokiarchaeota archaeon]|nr:MoaD/ThiS family protein [Candidatus Lokiarchaeota archaeon]
MIRLKFHFSPPFNELTKVINTELDFESEMTLTELFAQLSKKYGSGFNDLLWDKKNKDQFSSFLSIVINGSTYRGNNYLNTILKDGDDLAFLYIYFGG